MIANGLYKFSNDVNNVFNDLNDEEDIWACGTVDDTYYQNLLSRGKYRPVVRLAEMHLINAEALIGQGKVAEAKSVLTAIASRRNFTFRCPVTSSNITKNLQDLWKTEMHQEGQRMKCLHRWNMASEVLGMGYQPHYKLLPIPTSKLSLNPNLVQNIGYW